MHLYRFLLGGIMMFCGSLWEKFEFVTLECHLQVSGQASSVGFRNHFLKVLKQAAA